MRYFFLFTVLITFGACQKEQLQFDSEMQTIRDYIATNNLTMQQDEKAFYFYNIQDGIDSISPVRNTGLSVLVNYKAYLLDGTIIINTNGTPTNVKLDESIYGWQLALARMDIMDTMQLILPSRLAYGEAGNATVPPNSIIAFEIELLDITPRF